MAGPLRIDVCTNCGMQDPVVREALERILGRYGERVSLQVQRCLYSCNFPAVVVAGHQILIKNDDPTPLEAKVAELVPDTGNERS